MAGERRERPYGRFRRQKRKVCYFCANKMDRVDFKEIVLLKRFVTDRGKVLPRRVSGNCAKHQRVLTTAIKRSRSLALLPYTA